MKKLGVVERKIKINKNDVDDHSRSIIFLHNRRK